MQSTPEEFKRLEVKKVIDKVLKNSKVTLKGSSIKVEEVLGDEVTKTSFSFDYFDESLKTIRISEQKGKGFIDGLFLGLSNRFKEEYPSLKKIRLSDYRVNPSFINSKKSLGTDAQATVILALHIEPHGIAEFRHKSRSMVHSSFLSALSAFQFYMNCEKSFYQLKKFLIDARVRNRGDIVSQLTCDLSKLTEVNTYDQKVKN